MTTASEFAKTGITGQTFREIRDKFGETFTALAETDQVMANYALAFAWYRDSQHLPVPEAYEKAMGLTTAQVEALFEDDAPEVQAAQDFGSMPLTKMP